MAIEDGGAAPGGGEIHILITQCLQNDFFLNLNCRLSLPKDAVRKLLIHPESEKEFSETKSRRKIDVGTGSSRATSTRTTTSRASGLRVAAGFAGRRNGGLMSVGCVIPPARDQNRDACLENPDERH